MLHSEIPYRFINISRNEHKNYSEKTDTYLMIENWYYARKY